eukprot:5693218-Ditylum_brightwellii.AAC.1
MASSDKEVLPPTIKHCRETSPIASPDNEMTKLEPGLTRRRIMKKKQCCIDWGFLGVDCCSGCTNFAASPTVMVPIDLRADLILADIQEKLNLCEWTHTLDRFICSKPWLSTDPKLVNMRHTQHDFIDRHFGITGITDSACSNTKRPNWKSDDKDKKPAARPKKARVSSTDSMPSLENN